MEFLTGFWLGSLFGVLAAAVVFAVLFQKFFPFRPETEK